MWVAEAGRHGRRLACASRLVLGCEFIHQKCRTRRTSWTLDPLVIPHAVTLLLPCLCRPAAPIADWRLVRSLTLAVRFSHRAFPGRRPLLEDSFPCHTLVGPAELPYQFGQPSFTSPRTAVERNSPRLSTLSHLRTVAIAQGCCLSLKRPPVSCTTREPQTRHHVSAAPIRVSARLEPLPRSSQSRLTRRSQFVLEHIPAESPHKQ
jgi:hypothetical protein